ncbi:MAG: glutaredoxin family protein [Patescibacteria group bacterium]
MKVTVYTIKDCAFSKQEKEYLNASKLVFEEKDLETNKDFLTEMLAISNNFAGTPVTRVEKDDGTIAVLKGFTKEEFDTTFGFTASPTTPGSENPTPTVVPPPINDTPIPPVVETPSAEVVSPALIPTPPVETPVVETPVTNDPLKSVMDDLQAKAEPTPAVVETPPADAPSIPDFPAK